MSDLFLETIRALVVSLIFIYLWIIGEKEKIRGQKGWLYILCGFGLILFGMLIDITDNFPDLNHYIIIGDTKYQAFLEKVIGYLLGFILLSIGFWKWIPNVIRLRQANEQLAKEIKERKRTEEELKKSEERHRMVVENSTEAITVAQDGIIKFMNPKMTDISGYSKEEYTSKPFEEFIHPDDKELLIERHRRRLKGEQVEPKYSFKIFDKSGNIKWLEINATLFSWNGKPATLNFLSDITDKKRTEEALEKLSLELEQRVEDRTVALSKANTLLEQKMGELQQKEETLRESENKYRLHFENASEVIFSIDRDLKIITISPSIKSFLGYRPEDLAGTRIPDLNIVAPEYLEKAVSETVRVFNGEKILESKYEFIAKDGKIKIAEVSGSPVFRDGEVICMVSVARDITKRDQLEKALKDSEARFKKLFQHAPDAYYLSDLEGKLIDGNKAAEELVGYQKEELIGKNFLEVGILSEDQVPKAIESLKKNVAGQPTEPEEFILIKKGGERLIVEIRTLLTEIDNKTAVLGIARDISKRKRFEEQLLHSHKTEAIAVLAGGIAHEFNNALTSIVGNIQLLEMVCADNKAVKKYTKAMMPSSHRMANLTSQLLAYAQGGKYQANFLSLSEFIEDTLPIIKPNIDPSIRINMDLPKDIFSVKADPIQIQMVLSAVMNNSAEAIEGEGQIKIGVNNMEIDAEFVKSHPGVNPGHYVCLTIEDDGKGMDEETESKIFDPFFTTKFMGRGLGMAAAYGIIRNHDGWIKVDSELEKGTAVHIYLPAIEAEEEVKKEAIVESKPEIAKGEGTILIIEDEEMVMNVTRAILEGLGYSVLEARTGKEAVEIVKTFNGDIDLALLDIKLPDISGDKAYPLIMKARPNLKVIVCSGYSIDSPARVILDAGAQDFIQKPFRVETLSKKLKKALEGK